jgi:hypothetical protein
VNTNNGDRMDTKQVIAEVNAQVKDDFKKATITRGETIRQAVTRMCRLYIDTNGKLTEKA